MFKIDVEALLLGNTCHVHQARTVGTCYELGTRLYMALHFILTHLSADGCFLNREHATETTTLVRTFGLYNVDAVNKL